MIKLKTPNRVIFDDKKYKIEFDDKSDACLECGLLVFCKKSLHILCQKFSMGPYQYFKRV